MAVSYKKLWKLLIDRDCLLYTSTAADMKMEMNSFIQVYFEDKKNELKENSIRNKQHLMNKHIVPYFGTRKMNEITPAEIIQWQNAIRCV